ncbi:MAG: NUDIX hydrolase [Burkholderiaceae bacterium]
MSTILHHPVSGQSAARPVPAVVAVVLRDENVLLVRRGNPPYVGYWGCPGGKIEPGERIEAAALRELDEETGVKAEAGQILTAFDVLNHDENGQLLQHYVLVAVCCRWISGEPVAADDALDARWFRLDELDESRPDLNRNVLPVVRLAKAAMGPQ